MKGKIIRGANPRGLFHYLIGTDKTKKNMQGRVIGGNMVPRGILPNANELTNIFIKAGSRRKKPAKLPVVHIPLRMPKDEDVSDDKWLEIANALMVEMKLTKDRPWILVKHPDDHVHLVTSAINYIGDLWHGHFEVFNLIKATNKLEYKFNLTVTPTLDQASKERILLSSGQRHKKIRQLADEIEMQLTPNEILAELIPAAIMESDGEFETFKRVLETKQVEVLQSKHTSGEVYGISFKFENAAIKGSKIARAFSWNGITALLETQKAACIAIQQTRDSVSNTKLAAPTAEPIPPNPVAEIAPPVEIFNPDSIPSAADGGVSIICEMPKKGAVISSSVPTSTPMTPDLSPPMVQTLDDLDPKLWDENVDAWANGKKILIENFHFDQSLIVKLHGRRRLWFLNENTLVTVRLALPKRKMIGVALTQIVPEILPPKILVPDQHGLFTTGELFSDFPRVIVTKNAIEAISYQQLLDAKCQDTLPGLVVSADAGLPPLWLVDWLIKSKKKLLFATKSKLTPDDILKALPQLKVNNQITDFYEIDVSETPSWHALLLERVKGLANKVPAYDVFQK